MIFRLRIFFVFALLVTGNTVVCAQSPEKVYGSFAEAFKNPLQVYKLSVRKSQLASIPAEIGTLVNLRELVLEKNLITSIPPEIGNLVNLEVLDLDQNRITAVPVEIGRLVKLRELDLDQNQITSLPNETGNLTALTDLDIHENRLRTLPSSMGKLKQLKVLMAYNNPLDSLPPEIGQLGSLITLNLKNCKLKYLPAEITNLSSVQNIDLSYNALTQLPTGPGKLTSARSLYLNNNQLSDLPVAWSSSPALNRLDLSSNQLQKVPGIYVYDSLTTLVLDKNKIDELPADLSKLKQLKWLSLANNNLKTIPASVAELPNLGTLILNYNQLTSLPKEIAGMLSLTQLYVDNNLLTDLPLGEHPFSALTRLSISHNKFTAVPAALSQMKHLEELWVDESLLKIIPAPLLAYKHVNGMLYNVDGTYAVHTSNTNNTPGPADAEPKSIVGNMTAAERQKRWRERLLGEINALEYHDHDWLKVFLKENLSYAFSSDELVEMVNKTTGYQKSFAFDLLDQQKDKRLFGLIVSHINDPDRLYESYFSNETALTGDVFVQAKSLNKKQRADLDSILIYTDNNLEYTKNLIDNLPLLEKYHDRLRQLAQSKPYAMFRLAAYKNPNDLSLMGKIIIKKPVDNINAIYIFPHTYFKTVIDSVGCNNNKACFYVYPAMVYRDEFSFKLIQKTLADAYTQKNYPSCNARSMFSNMLKYYIPLYDSILFDTWQKDIHLPRNYEIKTLCTIDPKRASGLLVKILDDPHQSQSYKNADVAEALLEADPSSFKKIISKKLSTLDYTNYQSNYRFFVEQVLKAPNEEAARILLDKLKQADYDSDVKLTVKAILACNNSAVDQDLLNILLHKKHLYYTDQNEIKLLLQEKGLLKQLAAMTAPKAGLLAEWRIVSVKDAKGATISVTGHLRLQHDSVYYYSLTAFWYRGKFALSETALKPDTISESGQADDYLSYHGGKISYRLPRLATSSVQWYASAFMTRNDSTYFTAKNEKVPVELFLGTTSYVQTDSFLVLKGAGEIKLKLSDSWYINWKIPYKEPTPYTSEYEKELPRRKLKNIPATIAGKPLAYYLNRTDIDVYSKLYIQGKLAVYESDTLLQRMLDSLNTRNTQTAAFYLQVTNSIIQQARGYHYYSDVRSKLREVCGIYFLNDPCRFFRQVKYGAYKMFLMDWQKYIQEKLWYNDEETLQQEAVYYRLYTQCAAWVPDWKKLVNWATTFHDPEMPPEEH